MNFRLYFIDFFNVIYYFSYDGNELDKKATNETDILENLLRKVEKRKRKQIKLKDNIDQEELIDFEEKKSKVVVDTFNDTGDYDIPEDEIDPITEGIEQQADDVADSGFNVLGEESSTKRATSVDVVLPSWLAHPTIVSTSICKSTASEEESKNISEISYIDPYIRGSLKEMNITKLFPVQEAVIPWILEAHSKPVPFRPRDICVSAPTGSGKTLAFAIPVVQLLSSRVERKIRALVVLPVAELAHQVFKIFKKLCEKTDLSVCLLSSQVPFHLEQEKLVESYSGKLFSKVDIIVTTPGRLVDHLHATKGFCLKSLKFLVIDEADRIMDAVFQNWLYHLDAHVRNTTDQLLSGKAASLSYNELESSVGWQPHKLLFSATLSQDPEKLQNLRLFQPKLFTSVLESVQEMRDKFAKSQFEESGRNIQRGEFIGKFTTPAELTEKYCITESRLKPLTLFALIKENKWNKFLCFTNSVESSGR